MDNLNKDLYKTPYYLNLARSSVEGPVEVPEFKNRVQSWSYWATSNLASVNGKNRNYVAIMLPGCYYQNNQYVTVNPHIELKDATLNRNLDSDIVLSVIGNSLLNKYWLYSEIKALRKSINGITKNDRTLIDTLESNRIEIVKNLAEYKDLVELYWDDFTAEIATNPAELTKDILYDIEDLTTDFPKLSGMNYIIKLNSVLEEMDKEYSIRRIGVWDIIHNENQVLTCLTPRLTKNSQFFSKAETESILSIYIDLILLKRIYKRYNIFGSNVDRSLITTKGYIIKLATKFGAKIPEASVKAGVNFVQKNSLDQAWQLIQNAITDGEYILLEKDEFYNSYSNITNKIKKLEEISQEEVNRILPLVMTRDHKLYRLTYGEK